MSIIYERAKNEKMKITSVGTNAINICDEAGRTYVLNETATYVYKLLNTPLVLDGIVRLCEGKELLIGASTRNLEKEIIDVLGQLLYIKIITRKIVNP